MQKILKLIAGILLIPIFFSVTGCSSNKFIPYEQTESYRTKVAYDTGLAQLRQKNREGLVSRTEFHRQWIELLKPTPSYWSEKELNLDNQYALYRLSQAVDAGRATEAEYRNLGEKINNRMNQVNAQINGQNQIQSQQLIQMMDNDYRNRQNEVNRQNELYRQQQQQAIQPKQNTINCVSTNHGSGFPVYTSCN
jgi:hypothetical protein